MMRKLIIFLVLFISGNILLHAQVDDTPEMKYWTGGVLSMNLSYQANISGAGSGSALFAGIVSPGINNGAGAIFSNPAELMFLDRPQVLFDTRVGLSKNNFGIRDSDILSEETLSDNTDDFLVDNGAFNFPDGNFREDTRAGGINIGQSGGVSSFAFALPLSKKLVVGAGYNAVINLNTDILLSGMRTYIKTEKQIGNNITPIDMIINSSVTSKMDFSLSSLVLSAGYEIYKNENDLTFAAGISFTRYAASNSLNNYFSPDGMMVISNSTEYYFNDPDDNALDFEHGETNKFYWKTRGNFEAVKWGGKFGFYYYPGEEAGFFSNFKFSLLYDYVPEMSLTDDNAYSESFQPKFITGRVTGDGDDELDIIIDSIDIAKPNLTVETFNPFSKEVRVNMPSSFTIGTDIKLGQHLFAFNYVAYSGEMSYEFDKYKIGKKASSGLRAGFDFKFPDKFTGTNWLLLPVRVLFLDIDGAIFQIFGKATGYKNPHYRAGVSLMTGNAIVEGFSDDDRKDLEDILEPSLITGISLGRTYTIYDNLNIGVLVFGFPDLLMKFSFGYNF